MKLVFSSIDILETWASRLLHFVLLPMIDVLLLALIYAQYASDFSYQVAVSSVLVSSCMVAMSSLSGLLVDNRFRGVDRYVISLGGSSYYWFSQIFVSAVVSLALSLINLALLGLFGAGIDLLLQAVMYLPFLLLSGLVLGFVAFVIAWRMENPYFMSNLLSGSALVLSGALIPIDQYPPILKELAQLLPLSGWLAAFYGDKSHCLHDAIVLLAWFLISYGIYLYQKKRIGQKEAGSIL